MTIVTTNIRSKITKNIKKKDKIRPLWRHYYANTQVVIFVIDSNDKQRIDDINGCYNNAKKELHLMLSEKELQDIILLIYANKQDLENVMDKYEIINRLELEKIENKNIKWRVQPTSAITGHGLHEGLDWVYKELKKRNKSKKRKHRK